MLLFSYLLSIIPTLWPNSLPGLGSIHDSSSPPATILTDSDTTTPMIRKATPEDAGAIARVIVEAFAPAPFWQYVYQFKDEYPAYHLECIKQGMLQILQSKSELYTVIANVIDSPTPSSSTTDSKPEAVSIAIWMHVKKGTHQSSPPSSPSYQSSYQPTTLPLLPLLFLPTHQYHTCSDQLDTNLTRKEDYDRQMKPIEWHYAQSPHHDRLYLTLLATRPDWDGHGFAAAQCRLGQRLAVEEMSGVDVTLVATPDGFPVYRSVGFEGVENVTIHRIDGDGTFWFEGMVWRP